MIIHDILTAENYKQTGESAWAEQCTASRMPDDKFTPAGIVKSN